MLSSDGGQKIKPCLFCQWARWSKFCILCGYHSEPCVYFIFIELIFSLSMGKKIPAILTLVNIAYGQSPLDTDGAMEKVCIKRFEFRENISEGFLSSRTKQTVCNNEVWKVFMTSNVYTFIDITINSFPKQLYSHTICNQ